MTMGIATARAELSARAVHAVVIGGSAGGIDALRVVLPALSRARPVAVLVALHVTPDLRTDRWSLVFSGCEWPVREAEDKERAQPGTVYVAPADYHLLVDRSGTLSLSADPGVNHSRPSIDVLLESAAWAFGPKVLGIVLSGANADGAEGLREIYAAGGLCWVQSPDDSAATLMPRAALQAVPSARILTVAEMVDAIRSS
jgi:two-component system, chemotaxis family, protein-glutamate methylesterase/glutaminase